jgi:phosphatidylinositol alpha 1,6-mannosyltransferase
MRIGIVTESFLPSVNGVTNSVVRLLEHLEHTQHDAIVVAPGEGPEQFGRFPVVRARSVSVPRYRNFELGIPSPRLRDALEQFCPDVVHLAAPFGLGAYAGRICRQIGVPTVAVYQTDVPGFLAHYGLGPTGNIVWKWVGHIHNQADLTLAPSSAAIDDLLSHGIANVQMWRRGVDGTLFSPAKRSDTLRAAWNSENRVVVGYVGRLAHEKRVEDLAVLANNPRVQLVVVGDGPQRERLMRLMPDAVFPGFLSGEALAQHFASFDVFVHTGVNETFCQTLQEALASGVPCVAPAQGGPLDIVADQMNGFLFNPGDTSHLRSCIERLLDGDTRARLAHRARGSVEHRTWHSVNQQLLSYLQRAHEAATSREAVTGAVIVQHALRGSVIESDLQPSSEAVDAA